MVGHRLIYIYVVSVHKTMKLYTQNIVYIEKDIGKLMRDIHTKYGTKWSGSVFGHIESEIGRERA